MRCSATDTILSLHTLRRRLLLPHTIDSKEGSSHTAGLKRDQDLVGYKSFCGLDN